MNLIPQEAIRNKKVMLDSDLAELYGVTTKRFNEQIKRNLKRFPPDFMFPLTRKEVRNLRSQIATSSSQTVINKDVTNLKSQFVTSSLQPIDMKEIRRKASKPPTSKWGGERYLPKAFTEQGIAMLSSVLNSDRAIKVNIQIMRAFVKMRELIASHKDLEEKIEKLERKMQEKFDIHDKQFKLVFQAFEDLKTVLTPANKPKHQIGFHP